MQRSRAFYRSWQTRMKFERGNKPRLRYNLICILGTYNTYSYKPNGNLIKKKSIDRGATVYSGQRVRDYNYNMPSECSCRLCVYTRIFFPRRCCRDNIVTFPSAIGRVLRSDSTDCHRLYAVTVPRF